ncbi:hypothetical protein Acr_10g0007690 [Actinidia rufa]|uniref:Uncharacterized protein n=1 Tax=Actinidia rufa TaxID=165716 RepID=A0A7J0F9K5_9ERIC|nr:hypothetical protein Acr_10g0007690 [Actinidia rufa]
MTWILTKTDSFHTGEEQGLTIDIVLSIPAGAVILGRCCDFGNGLLSDEGDEISRHQECEEQLKVVDWAQRRAVSSGCYFHSSISSVRPYRVSHDRPSRSGTWLVSWRRESRNGQFPYIDRIWVEINQIKFSTLPKGEEKAILRHKSIDEGFKDIAWHYNVEAGFHRMGVWRHAGESYNALPVLTEAKRTVEVIGKIEPRGYFDMSKVLGSKTFTRHFVVDCMEVSSSGGDKATLSDENESRGDFQGGSSSLNDFVEYIGIIRGDIGRAVRNAFPSSHDMTLLRWLRGKVKDPFANVFFIGPSSSSDSGSESLPDSGLSPELRSDAICPDQEGWGEGCGQGCRVDGDTSTTHEGGSYLRKTSSEGRFRCQERRARSFKGKEAMPPPKRIKSNRGGDQCSRSHIRVGDFISAGQQSWIRSFYDVKRHYGAKAESRLVELGEQAARPRAELDRSEGVARLEAKVAKLTSKLVQAKKLAIEEFKSFEDFKYPNLGIDMASMEMDASFAEEEEVKEGEKEVGNEGRAGPAS